MHPRIVMLAVAGVVTDLLCLAAVAAVLLTNNIWLGEVGVARFSFVIFLIGIGLVPLMYVRERAAVAKRIGDSPENLGGNVTAWAGVERSYRTA